MAEHITIGDTAPRIQYIASGTDKGFIYPFPIFHPGDIAVYLGAEEVFAGFSVIGAGRSEGGVVLFDAPPPSGTIVTLRRWLTLGRVTDFQENGELRASSLNDELDFQAAALQQVAEDGTRAIQFDPTDIAPSPVLPARPLRANRIIGFDSAGAFTLHPLLSGAPSQRVQQRGPGAVERSAAEKLGETFSVRDFGATGDGTTDDRATIQAAFDAAASGARIVTVPEGDYMVSGPLSLPAGAGGLEMRGRFVYVGAAPAALLTLGAGASGPVQGRIWRGLRVGRLSQSAWDSEADIGIVAKTPSDCTIEVVEVVGFTTGIRVLAEGGRAAGSTLSLGRIAECRFGLDLRNGNQAGAVDGLRVLGGRFTVSAGVNDAAERFGVRLSAALDANRTPGGIVFEGPAFALGSGAAGIPFLVQVDSRGVIARDIVLEGPTAIIARHTGAAEDHRYEVAASPLSVSPTIEYQGSANRAGGAVVATQGASPHLALTRPVALLPNLRAAAFRWSWAQTGFDLLACIDGAAPPPSSLAAAARPGLDGYLLGGASVTLGPGRGLGFTVDARACRQFALAVDGAPVRLVVFCFDAAGTPMTDQDGTLVRASSDAMLFDPARGWWASPGLVTSGTRTAHPAVTLAPTVATALIGVVRANEDAELRALRLYADARTTPALHCGLPGLPHGSRTILSEIGWDPPALAPGSHALATFSVPGASPGDSVAAAFTSASPTMLVFGTVTAPDAVSVVLWNWGATVTDLAGGALRLRVMKT